MSTLYIGRLVVFGCLLSVLSGCSGGGALTSGNTPAQTSKTPLVSITGEASVRLGGTLQFTATVTNTTDSSVIWSVNGVTGGNSNTGTISSSGLYTAPQEMPTGGQVVISASSQAAAASLDSKNVGLQNPLPVVTTAMAVAASGQGGYTVTVTGTSFVAGAKVLVEGQELSTSRVSSTLLSAFLPGMAASSGQINVAVKNPDPGSAVSSSIASSLQQLSLAAAARFVDQTTFGATPALIQHVQQVGTEAWLEEQFQASPSQISDIPTTLPAACSAGAFICEESGWWKAVLNDDDQLRQRVAFALSQIFVVSANNVDGRAVAAYSNMLTKNAFGNWYDLMRSVTLSPAMGIYLNMLNNAKASGTRIANENYARENLQLFNIGLNLLNQDGSLQLDAGGNPQSTYTEAQVQAFAKVYTGWTYANADGSAPNKFLSTVNYAYPLAPVESLHDTTTKTLLNGEAVAAGQTAVQDLDAALKNIFNHPNVPPFICRQLIQHLVTGHPSPAYVRRVADVFVDNGSHVRGDLKAVVRAILLDPEARAADSDAAVDVGHLREPILWMANVFRGLGFTNIDTNESYYSLSTYTESLGQPPYRASSVFSFYSPGYVIPGTSKNSPEFALENTAAVLRRASIADLVVNNKIGGFRIDLSATSSFGKLAANPADLVDALSALFLHARMSNDMRTALISHISGLKDPAQRARVAVFLVISSSDFKVLN